MRTLFRFFFGCFACLLAGQAFALIPQQPGYYYTISIYSSVVPAPASSQALACAAYTPAWKAVYSQAQYAAASSSFTAPQTCQFNDTIATRQMQLFQNLACPANSTVSGSSCACNTGYDETGGNSCVAHTNQCTGKPAGVVNWTAGWQRTPTISNSEPFVAPNAIPGGATTMCVGGCTTEINVSDPCPGCSASVSQSPNAQGLYRVSIQFMGKPSGAECTAGASDKAVTPNDAQDPPCPGYVGDVNGVKGCYGTAANPVAGTPPPPQVQLAPKVPGNPPAGPSSAGASTPSTGAGGSAGGPAGAATGPGGSGGTGTVSGSSNGSGRVATQGGTEQANCGAPGQPSCRIDETGTATGVGTSFDAANTSVDTSFKSKSDAIASFRDSTAPGPAWSFSFQLPTGCTQYQVGQFKNVMFTMNPCAYQSTIHDLMSMIWAAVTAFCCIGMVGRTLRST